MIGNEEDFTASLGFEVEGNDKDLKSLNMDGYYKMIETVTKAYPNFKVIATTLRTVKTATVNDWKAICWADGKIYNSIEFPGLEIMDRVGGGDSFASGLVYGLMTYEDAQKAVNYGVVHGALAMTTPGDTSMASLKEVEAKVNGGSARVQRQYTVTECVIEKNVGANIVRLVVASLSFRRRKLRITQNLPYSSASDFV